MYNVERHCVSPADPHSPLRRGNICLDGSTLKTIITGGPAARPAKENIMKPKFSVIKGGLDIPKIENGRTFISGTATNTRLMGVIGLELTWDVLRDSGIEKLHQIFYLDCEEYGIESYTEAYGDMPAEIFEERTRLCGALGGGAVPVSEKEARFLIQSHMRINSRYDQPLPDGRGKYAFLTKPEQTLTGAEYIDLFKRLSGNEYNPNYVINHFLMRCVSSDARGAAWLLSDNGIDEADIITPDYRPDMSGCGLFSSNDPKTLCRNSIDPTGDPDDHIFFCESLIEFSSRYQLTTSLITLSNDETRVVSASLQSDFRVTGAEAAMLMNRSEFITVYEVLDYSEEFIDAFTSFAAVFTETVYENGKLYVAFNETNAHVGQPVYMINNDIHAMYYLTDYGQIIIMGYSFEDIQDAEFRMYLSLLPYPIVVSMKYEFKEPVFYDFIKSDFTDFDSFVEFLGGDIDTDADSFDDTDDEDDCGEPPADLIKIPYADIDQPDNSDDPHRS